jgi:hypothetical protein
MPTAMPAPTSHTEGAEPAREKLEAYSNQVKDESLITLARHLQKLVNSTAQMSEDQFSFVAEAIREIAGQTQTKAYFTGSPVYWQPLFAVATYINSCRG